MKPKFGLALFTLICMLVAALTGCTTAPPRTAADIAAQMHTLNDLAEIAKQCPNQDTLPYEKRVFDGVVTEEGATLGYNIRTACSAGNDQLGQNWQVPRPHFRQSQVPIYSGGGGGYGYGGY